MSTMNVTVATAVELSKSQLEALSTQLKKKYGAGIKIQTKVDSSLIGGIKVTAGSQQLDGSIQHKLAVIKQQLKSQF